MKSKISKTGLMLRGFAMGIAEVIPGVSGGTIAFISGIYTQLLDSIKAILSFEPFLAFKADGWKGLWKKIDGDFMLYLLLGMAVGLILGVFVITHLMENHPIPLWSFFFGLIIASTWFIAKQIPAWNITTISLFVLGTVLAYLYTVVSPTNGNEALWFVFISGTIAISALLLPGISGSFILLLLGMYSFVVGSVKNLLIDFNTGYLLIVFVFGLGCLLGLATFSRFLSWLFKIYPNQTLALLTGFMLGSLNKVWPWKIILSWRINSEGEEVPLLEKSVSPFHIGIDNPQLLMAVFLMVLGASLMFIFDRLELKRVQK
jgi:putative membrane protein